MTLNKYHVHDNILKVSYCKYSKTWLVICIANNLIYNLIQLNTQKFDFVYTFWK